MAKELVKYSKITAAKGKMKKWYAGMGQKATTEQRFLGKTLPKAVWNVAKWGFKHPITTTALAFAPTIVKAIGKEHIRKAPKVNPWTKKGRWML